MGIQPEGYPLFVNYRPCYQRYVMRLSKAKIARIKKFAAQLAKAKTTERHYRIDGEALVKRTVTGLLGEAAVEKLLGISIIDWTIGHSKKYNKPDINIDAGLRVGIKTVEYGLFPLVRVNPISPEIICIKTQDDEVLVCGVASVAVLKKYQDKKLVRPAGARRRGAKAGFFGFDYLKRFTTVSELRKALEDMQHE